MKKNHTQIIFLILTLVLTYIGYKTLVFANYKVDTEVLGNETIKFNGTLEVKSNNYVSEGELKEHENVTYKSTKGVLSFYKKNLLKIDDYTIDEYFVNKTDDGDYSAIFKVAKGYDLYEIFSTDDILVFGLNLKAINRKKLLEKYNINNDIDIINYLIDNKDTKTNVFSSSTQIRMDYFMKTFASGIFPKDEMYLIEGDYKGYMFSDNNYYYEVHLLNNDEHYIFSFINKIGEQYFQLDDVKDFISNVTFAN